MKKLQETLSYIVSNVITSPWKIYLRLSLDDDNGELIKIFKELGFEAKVSLEKDSDGFFAACWVSGDNIIKNYRIVPTCEAINNTLIEIEVNNNEIT